MLKFLIKELDNSLHDTECRDEYGLTISYILQDNQGAVIAQGRYSIAVSSWLCHRTNGAPVDSSFAQTWNTNLIFSLFKQISFQWRYFENLPADGTKFTYTPIDLGEYPDTWRTAELIL